MVNGPNQNHDVTVEHGPVVVVSAMTRITEKWLNVCKVSIFKIFSVVVKRGSGHRAMTVWLDKSC